MDPAEAARVCGDVIRIVLQERSGEPQDRDTRNAIDGIVAMLLPRLDRGAAHLCANELSMLMFAEADVNNADPAVRNRGMMVMTAACWRNRRRTPSWRKPARSRSLADRDHGDEGSSRITGVTCAVSNHGSRFGRRALPLPPHHARTGRPAQDADVLRPGASVVLDHLGNRYGRRFDNHWAFVRFAREQGLGLDFTTPPKRPDPTESVKRMLVILAR